MDCSCLGAHLLYDTAVVDLQHLGQQVGSKGLQELWVLSDELHPQLRACGPCICVNPNSTCNPFDACHFMHNRPPAPRCNTYLATHSHSWATSVNI